MRYFISTLASVLLFACHVGAQPAITTVAGGGPNNVSALAANLDRPVDVTIDAAGNFFIAAQRQDRVFRVDTSGQLTVYAGVGVPGPTGDGGAATNAGLFRPHGVVVDGSGNLFIADTNASRIRRVDAVTGIMTTVAGNGSRGFSGDGGPATSARLNMPFGIALDASGNLFIVDRDNFRIRRVDAVTGIITTVAGNGVPGYSGDGGPATSASLNFPHGAVVDASGNLFITDTNNQRIRRVDAATGIITTVAGSGPPRGFSGDGGPATSAQLAFPFGIAIDGSGNLFFSDFDNRRIRRVDAVTGIITTVAGNGACCFSGDGGPATSARLGLPWGVAVDGLGNLLIADSNDQRVRRVDAATGIIDTVAGTGNCCFSGDGGPATNASLTTAFGIAVDNSGNLYISDKDNLRIRKVDGATAIIDTVAGSGNFGVSGDGGPATSATFRDPINVALDASGNLFIVDEARAHRVRRVDAATGIMNTVAGIGLSGFSGDGGLATSARLNGPTDVVVDGAGNLFIADRLNHRIRRVDAITGIISTVAGNGTRGSSGDGGPATGASLNFPFGIALDALGNLYIADTANSRIRKVVPGADGVITGSADEIITTAAGVGSHGFSGDGGPATSARLRGPFAVAADAFGNLFIADTNNLRIRRVDAVTGTITTVAGGGSQFLVDGVAATDAELDLVYDVEVDSSGSLFIATASKRVRRVGSTNKPPVARCQNVTVDTDSGICSTALASVDDGSFDPDGDPITLLQDPGGPYDLGVASVTLTVTDDQGGSDSCDAEVRVIDSEAPEITCPDVLVVECTAVSGAAVSFSPTVGDNCPGATGISCAPVPDSIFAIGTHEVSCTATDASSNDSSCSFAVTVTVAVDGLKPPLVGLVPEGDVVPFPDKAFKQGRTVPLKLQLFCGGTSLTGSDVASPQIISIVREGDALDLGTIDTDSGQANDGGLLFRYSEPNWVYNLGTKALNSGTYSITIEVPDGQRYVSGFVLK